MGYLIKKGLIMVQIHKKFSVGQVKVLLASYESGHIGREEIQSTLDIGKTRFFALLKQYRSSPKGFTIEYHPESKGRLSQAAEEKIQHLLLQEKHLVENKELRIGNYNYATLADRLKKAGVKVSTITIIKRAKPQGCYLARKRRKIAMTVR
jgi:hypothetical protein